MKILVTGGAGYLGSALVAELAASDQVEEVVVYDNLSRGNYNFFLNAQKLSSNVRFIEADILDSRSFQKAIKNMDIVYHLAAKATTPFADRNAQLFEQVNHWGTAETVYSIEKSDVRRFIFMSSASVYGTSDAEMDEQTIANPKTIYGRSKLNAEKQVSQLTNSDVEAYIIRCGNIYGYDPSMRFDGVINRFAFDANFRGRITINGDGEQHRSFIPIEMAAAVSAQLAFTDLTPHCYNLVQNSMTINEIADELSQIFPELERVYINQDLQLNQLKVKPNAKLNRLGNWPEMALADYLKNFVSRFSF